MTLPLNPPPLQVPSDFLKSKPMSAFFSGLLNTLYQIWTSLYSIRASARVETTDATPTGIIRTQLQSDTTVMIQAHIVARRTGGSAGTLGDSAFYVLTGAYKNIGGVLTGIGTPTLYGGEDQAAWDVGFTSSGDNVAVVVTGAANNNITWVATISTYEVGS